MSADYCRLGRGTTALFEGGALGILATGRPPAFERPVTPLLHADRRPAGAIQPL